MGFFFYFWPAKLSISEGPGLTIASDCIQSLDVGLEKCVNAPMRMGSGLCG